MAHSAMSPKEIADHAKSGGFDIPEFQRGFVWPPEKVKSLLDSLCKDYPVGAILCWRSKEYKSAKLALGTEPEKVWLVDGQQRTTALCLLLGQKPYWFPAPEPWNTLYKKCNVHVDLKSTTDQVELSLPNPIVERAAHWYPVRELLQVKIEEVPAKAMELLGRLGVSPTDTAELGRLMGIINLLQAALRREIIVIEIGHDPVDVAEIFSRLNSAGTRVNEGDIALALIAVRQEGWVRDQLLPYLEDLSEHGFGFDPSFVIRTMVAVRKGVARLKDIRPDFWEKGDEFENGWQQTKNAVNNVRRILNELGILSVGILPGRNVLIPLFYLDHVHIHGDAAKLRKAFIWLLRATRDGRYSGSAITTIDQDLAAITAASDWESALKELHSRLEVKLAFEPQDTLLRYDEDGFLRLMLYLVAFHRGAEDWRTGQRLGFDRSELNEGFRPEWHHFVPRGRLKRRNPRPSEDQINCLANIVVLSEGDNRRFSYNEPHKYLAKYQIPDERVHQQLFPDRSLWTTEKFEQFVEERSKLLAQGMNDYIKSLEQ